MKKLKNTAIAICLLGFMITSCGKNETEQLAKTWQVSDIETSVKLADSVKTKMLNNSVMVFTKDGHYNTNGGIGVDQGTYLDKDGKNLSTISEAGKDNSVYVIEKLSDDKLVLNNNGNTLTCTAKK
ncbi:MAG: Lipocalin-like protein [Sphingobacteriales bacterium]|nr:Lipocalin-like protein [Sphingobacteriales bacterium]